MHDNLHAEYGNAGHKFPRTTQEAFGPGACVFVSTECEDDDDEVTIFEWCFAVAIYTLGTIVVSVILLG